MKKYTFILLSLAMAFSSCDEDDFPTIKEGFFAVANRVSGTVSIYSSATQTKVTDITLPDEDAAPTYVVYSNEKELLYVADFNNQKILAYDVEGFTIQDSYNVNEGAFHMWVNDKADQIWVNNIVSKTTSVISTNSGSLLATLPLAADGITFEDDAAQHDVVLQPNGKYAYVSIFSQLGQNYVIQYDTDDFTIENVEAVGGDPHLSVNKHNLYILSQDDANIKEYQFRQLTATGKMASIPNAHGVTANGNRSFFVTNISDREIAVYDVPQARVKGGISAAATAGSAHNVAFSSLDNVLALTISGGTTVEFFAVDKSGSDLSPLTVDESGQNPFGIGYFEVKSKPLGNLSE